MTDGDMWGQDEAGVDAFVLPGDDKIEQQLAGKQTAVAEPEPEATEQAEPAETEERARDEHGRFAKKEDEQPEETVEETPVETPAETTERLYAGKYKTVEELERAQAEAQAVIDRQGNELGEWRQYAQRVAQEQQQQAQQPQAPLYENFEDMVAAAPDEAMELAWQRQDRVAYEYAKREWEEAFPGGPRMWERMKALEQQAAQQAQQMQAQTAPLQAQYDQQQWDQSVAQFIRENPGVQDVPVEELIAAGQRNPAFIKLIQQSANDPDARLGVLRLLHLEHEQARGRKSDTLVNAAQDIARVQAEATRQAKAEGILASANANLDGGPKKTGAELVGEQWDKMTQPYDDGWNI